MGYALQIIWSNHTLKSFLSLHITYVYFFSSKINTLNSIYDHEGHRIFKYLPNQFRNPLVF